ncbi:hypothetical protein JQX14_17660 [Sulfitobacter pseudonitzschiae]|uniref:Uncharacterized protein n=2 Tax=Pseudosulfitobacter pseudonitzschiae TaxID=1402135 RepID=A0A9Q2NSY7_9RHOB|nr:hypothetical protein [Pseudosulfitobacter pseudonitzschiae]MBM2356386.1 hypothetical protein [Pseudosulfitobacter pseudonitzschiae]
MAVRQNLRIRQGETFQFAFVHLDVGGTAVDLSGYEGRLTMRADFSASSEAYLTSTGGDVQGTITLAADGTVTLDMTAGQTSALLDDLSELLIFGDRSNRAERFVEFIYDLSLIDGVVVTRALQGKVIVEREVTR